MSSQDAESTATAAAAVPPTTTTTEDWVVQLPAPIDIATRSMDDDLIADRMLALGAIVLVIPLLVVAIWLFRHTKPLYHVYGLMVAVPAVVGVLFALVRAGAIWSVRAHPRARHTRRERQRRRAELARHRFKPTNTDAHD